jgi:hypothetical protein
MAFASTNIRTHLLRGVAGIVIFAFAVRLGEHHGWLALALVPVAVWLLRGCPMCWAIGLVEIVAKRVLARHEGLTPAQACPGCPVGPRDRA